MSLRCAPIIGVLLLGGCAYHVAEQTDRIVADLAKRSYDREPTDAAKPIGGTAANPAPTPGQASAETKQNLEVALAGKDVQTANYLEAAPADDPKDSPFKLTIPGGLPGSEVPPLRFKTKEEMIKEIQALYPPLPPLPEEPKPLPRPDGRPYTLAEFQEMAAMNNPSLKQAVADLKSAEGYLVQARTYQNPRLGYRFDPSNDGETAGVQGIYMDQVINTGGKMKLVIAAARKDYENAELALKKARSDLATQVRSAYFGLLVARETMRVNRALSILTDEIYRAQVSLLLKGGQAAGYEPASLRAQAYSARLALTQSRTSYLFAWKQVVATVGLRQLPLGEVAGRIDAHIPYFDYDAVITHVLANHTDMRIAGNTIEKARYNRKLAQLTPYVSDVDVQLSIEKEFSLAPFQWFAAGQLTFTIPVWDRNRGNIMAAEAALVRAAEQPHAAELNLTNNLQNAYETYKNNLDALDYYRRHILPDQVRAYRGVLDRRQIDPNAQFGDLVQAQQTLATNVSSYLTILAQLWTSAVTVADFLQTDDMFALARPETVPALPNVEQLMPLPGCQPVQATPNAGHSQPTSQVAAENSATASPAWLPKPLLSQPVSPLGWPSFPARSDGLMAQPTGDAAAQQRPATVPDARSGP